MDKTLAGIVGAVGALVAGASAQAAGVRPAVLEATSYSDLLRPVANAQAALRALDEGAPEVGAAVEQVQYYAPGYYPPPYYYRHHHHHHHHRYYYRQRYHHHHHHHHHNRYER